MSRWRNTLQVLLDGCFEKRREAAIGFSDWKGMRVRLMHMFSWAARPQVPIQNIASNIEAGTF